MVVAFPDGGRQGPRAYAIGTNTQKFKKIKDFVQPHQSTASLIMHILEHITKIKEQILAELVRFLSVSSQNYIPGS